MKAIKEGLSTAPSVLKPMEDDEEIEEAVEATKTPEKEEEQPDIIMDLSEDEEYDREVLRRLKQH